MEAPVFEREVELQSKIRDLKSKIHKLEYDIPALLRSIEAALAKHYTNSDGDGVTGWPISQVFATSCSRVFILEKPENDRRMLFMRGDEHPEIKYVVRWAFSNSLDAFGRTIFRSILALDEKKFDPMLNAASGAVEDLYKARIELEELHRELDKVQWAIHNIAKLRALEPDLEHARRLPVEALRQALADKEPGSSRGATTQ